MSFLHLNLMFEVQCTRRIKALSQVKPSEKLPSFRLSPCQKHSDSTGKEIHTYYERQTARMHNSSIQHAATAEIVLKRSRTVHQEKTLNRQARFLNKILA